MNIKRYLSLLFVMLSSSMILAQKIKPLKVGDRCPDFLLKDLINTIGPIKLSQLKGKLILLDFGGIGCKPCVASALRSDSLWHNGYDRSLLPVWCMSKLSWTAATKDTKSQKSLTAKFLPKNKNGKPISIPVDWGDSYLYDYFPHLYYPHIIWINEKGIIVAITDHDYINEHFIKVALSGKTADWPIKNDLYNKSKKLMAFDSVNINTLRQNPYPISYYSIFPHLDGIEAQLLLPSESGIDRETGKPKSQAFNAQPNSTRVLMTNLSLLRMYISILNFTVPFDQPNFSLLIQINSKKNRALFADAANPYNNAKYEDVEWKKNNTFCYDGVFPVMMSDDEIRKSVALHLDETFGIHGRLEKRLVDCWVITGAGVKTQAFNSAELPDDSLYREGDKVKRLKGYMNLSYVAWNGNRIEGGPPIIDESKTSDNQKVFITQGDLMDFDKLNAALNPYGLVVKKEKRELEMLVITEIGYQPPQQP